jgi:GT2 family glycosyltransferase
VIPTFRRPDSLLRTLKGLARQKTENLAWDVLVVDNDEPPGASSTFDEAKHLLPVPARLVREPRRGASHARNRGISEVRAPITAFLDDDVVPEPGWLQNLVEPLAAARGDGIAGRVVLDPDTPRPTWFTGAWHDTPFGVHDYGDEERLLGEDEFTNTANAAVVTEYLRATGGFDAALGPRDGVPLLADDVHIHRQLVALGARMLYAPDAVVVHDLPIERLTRRYLIRRHYFWGRSAWLSDREKNAGMRLAGTGGAASKLARELREAAGDRPWRPSTLYRVAADTAFAAGYAQEAARCLLRGRRIDLSTDELRGQDGSSVRP